MKKLILVIVFIASAINMISQNLTISKLKSKLALDQPDSSKFKILEALTQYYYDNKPDSLLLYAKQALIMANSCNNLQMKISAFNWLGTYQSIVGNYPMALQMQFKSLQFAESAKDSQRISNDNIEIGITYYEYKDYDKSILYYLKSKRIAEKIHKRENIMLSSMNLGLDYEILNNLDSALLYEQQAYTMAIKTKSVWIGGALITLGNIHLKLQNKNLALEYYNMGIKSFQKEFGSSRVLSWGYLVLAEYYKKFGQKDSAIYYAHQSMKIAKEVPYLRGVEDAGRFLAAFYESHHQIDSAFYYQKIFITIHDSLDNRTRVASVENITLLEEIREQEIAQAVIKANEERKQNIQYALIALCIVILILIFLLLSRSLITNTKLIEFLCVSALLIVFEFVNLLIHPFLEGITHNTPILMLLGLVLIAAIIVPFHHRIEIFFSKNLVKKNKENRLAIAKKTIEKLEEK